MKMLVKCLCTVYLIVIIKNIMNTCFNIFIVVDLVSSCEMSSQRLLLYQEHTQLTLSHYASLTSPTRFGALLLVLPALNGPIASKIKTLLFNPVIGGVPIEHIIAVI